MTLGNKLSKLRRENNITQEQLAEKQGVSRQAVSKWESDTTYPETDKIIALSKLYGCTTDYLLRDDMEEMPKEKSEGKKIEINLGSFSNMHFERKSKRMVKGIPLWHINIGFGRTAKGIFAVGLCAKGVFSLGLLSMGVFSLGLLSLGIIALGTIALGIVAAGAIAAGIIAFGAICFGVLAVGALAMGEFSVGALARGHYFAMGDNAKAMVAIGKTHALGSVYSFVGERTADVSSEAMNALSDVIPVIYRPIVGMLKSILM